MPPVGSFPSSSSLGQRIPMDFTNGWGKGGVFAWYRKLQKSSVMIDRLQIRIDNSKPPHRFLLVFLHDGTVCRFDRRPERLKLTTVMGVSSHRAADDYCTLQKGEPEQIESSTRCELGMNMPPNTDLLLILSACFGLAQDIEASDYSLLKYNCYFFSWTIAMIVARHTLPIDMPSPTSVAEGLLTSMGNLTDSLTDKAVDALLKIVLYTTTEFRTKVGRSLKDGLSTRELLIWGLSTRALRFLIRQCLQMRLYFGLEANLKQRIREQLVNITRPLLEDVLRKRNITEEQVGRHLWIDELMVDIRPLVQEQLLKIIWDTVLDAISFERGNTETQQVFHDIRNHPKMSYRLKYYLLGQGAIQFTRVWNDAMDAAIPAAREAGHGISQSSHFASSRELHLEMFDTVFNAASEAALKAAKNTVDSTRQTFNNPKRDEMWEQIWYVWDDVWKSAQEKARTMSIEIVEASMDEIVNLVTRHVVTAVGSNQHLPLQASVSYQKSRGGQQQATLVTIADFQTKILQSVRSTYLQATEPFILSVQVAMTRAWDVSRRTYKPLDDIVL